MKKVLVTALVCIFLMGLAGVAMAAPASIFSDVPADHWAYKAVNTLAKDKIVEGYGDGTYRGDRTMTRYEMAQIIANAMTKVDKASAEDKALINKLAKEFAAELEQIDARLAKVEKKAAADHFNWAGEATLRWISFENRTKSHAFQSNYRIWMNAPVNDQISTNLRFINMKQTSFGTNDSVATNNDNLNTCIEANIVAKDFLGMGNATATAGRFNVANGATGYWMNFWGVDGAKLVIDNKAVKVEIGGGDFSNPLTAYGTTTQTSPLQFQDAYYANVKWNTSKATQLQGYYIKSTNVDTADIWGVGLSTKFAKDFLLRGDYIQNNAYSADNTATYVRLNYKGNDLKKPGTWGIGLGYVKAEPYASVGWGDYNTTSLCPTSNIEDYEVVLYYTLAKNVQLLAGQTFNSKNPVTGADSANGEWSRVQLGWFF